MTDCTLSFKSFYFCLGTTSFRMQDFNKKIELQLDLLSKFWHEPEFTNQQWTGNEHVQEAYYNFIKANGFLKDGEAQRKAKDAREKTSGLRDLGLIDDNRRLTAVGSKILDISKSGNFTSDNLLQIPKDSFIYFQQLLKTHVEVNKGVYVRPYVVLLRLLNKFQCLTRPEFMYLFPLCIDADTTDLVENYICMMRRRGGLRPVWTPDINYVLLRLIMRQRNYQEACDYFIREKIVTEDTFCKIGLNRKSKVYDKRYFPLYKALKKISLENDRSDEAIEDLFSAIRILSYVSNHWVTALFGIFPIKNEIIAKLKNGKLPLQYWITHNEDLFREAFFKAMHLIKTRKTLEDYYDLNRRYLNLSDTILFADNIVKLDIIPKHYFSAIPVDFYNIAFKKSESLFELQALNEISQYLQCNENFLLNIINHQNNKHFSQIGEIKQFVIDEKIQRFNTLINKKFTGKNLIRILNNFKTRNDKEINKLVTDNADIPTIYEYITAIAWYEISDRQGDIFSFMNLSLDADLLPKTHAAGGEADLIFQYETNEAYPKHSLLIEVTLSDSTNQRRMEMEPVSRHLGDYLVSHNGHDSYCVFLTNNLNLNVISDFRSRRHTEYYGGKNSDTVIHGMMIIPLENDLLISILEKNIKYTELYKIFHDVFNSELPPKEWYGELKSKIDDIPPRCTSFNS